MAMKIVPKRARIRLGNPKSKAACNELEVEELVTIVDIIVIIDVTIKKLEPIIESPKWLLLIEKIAPVNPNPNEITSKTLISNKITTNSEGAFLPQLINPKKPTTPIIIDIQAAMIVKIPPAIGNPVRFTIC